MKAVVMAGGEGSRLRPITSLMPKPMVPIVNQPVMEHILGLVKHHGMSQAVATLAFMPQVIQDYFGDGEEWGMEISYAIEESPLGTAGSVKNAEALLRDTDDPFVVISGDALTDIDLTALVAFHRERGAAVTIALVRVPDPLEFGVVITDESGRIERFLEKPTWGQVFSDTINTGIYVVEPWVLDRIPEGASFDFSSDLFPLLMDEGAPLYGMIVDGYWCDVGSRESYLQVHKDILDGKAKLFVPGVQASGNVWVGDGAIIDPTATLGDNIVLGKNAHIRAGAFVGDYSVLGDNVVVGVDARVVHSVVWDDAFLGRGSSVAGAVLCRRVDVRARAHIDSGATIGDEVMVGQGAHVGTGVQVFPFKRIDPSAIVNTSIIWQNAASRTLFGEEGVSGLVGVDITPELSLKLAQAFGTVLPKGAHVVMSRDTSKAARMIKRALAAGINSAGVHVRDLRVASPAVNRFTTRDTRCVGGIHVCAAQRDPQSLEIHFYDKRGLDLAPWDEKKVERLYFRNEFRRAFFDEVGDILYPPRALEYYTAGLIDAISRRQFDEMGTWRKVIADMQGGVATFVLPQAAHGWNINLVAMNAVTDSELTMIPGAEDSDDIDNLKQAVRLFNADFGVRFEPSGERVRFVTPAGTLLDGDTALHAMVELWCRTSADPRPIAVPLQASRVVERIADAHGYTVVRPGRTRRSLASVALAGDVGFAGSTGGGYMFADFLASYDGVMAVGMLNRMLAAAGLKFDEVVEALPTFSKREVQVMCPADRKGAVMRAVTEASAGMDPDLTEGILVTRGTAWALVLPHASEPLVHVFAEGDDPAQADALLGEWRTIVEEAITAG